MPHLPATFSKQGIRCLLFDLGDTLWYREDQERWEQLESASNRRAADLLRSYTTATRLPLSDERSLEQRLRQTFDEQIRTMIRSAPLLEPDGSQAMQRVLRMWGIESADSALSSALFEALRVRVPHSRTLFADALTTLAELRRRGFLLGVVTNRLWGGEPFYQDLATMGLLDYFESPHIAISGNLGIRKPNPDIFGHVLQTLQVSPPETAMIGDSLSADILGAQPLGITAIWRPKPWLRAWALAQVNTASIPANNQPYPLSRETFPGIDTADAQIEERTPYADKVPQGMYITDDDYILARADNSRDYLEQFRHGEIRPDYVIGQLTDLLEIFPGAAQP
ncbi:MAG: HAD family hydrolase [Ktedonobacteraceae bacterium]